MQSLNCSDESLDKSEQILVAVPQSTIALFSSGDLFEDFHDTIGVSLETFRDELTGGWLFNYVDALRQAGVQTVLFFVSARVSETLRFTHVARSMSTSASTFACY
jgi:hypothetical protein